MGLWDGRDRMKGGRGGRRRCAEIGKKEEGEGGDVRKLAKRER